MLDKVLLMMTFSLHKTKRFVQSCPDCVFVFLFFGGLLTPRILSSHHGRTATVY